ncbi:penicillin-binding transpeptidase domain-containing protein [Enteractinococcus coprophilus]|uniref:Beta-lactamase n=1 Tax=Enteractinococcus coprophilus TaxID=1027633 RepID=A0A543AJ04_9MICC|nr:penicillin-binding transpeptidase domain-containing protein [Enteractinococcus coprophilus]TQL72541.1 cell division protein FtsI/penicillin-binding protein 2 [Enteractinococcus coprophilus]
MMATTHTAHHSTSTKTTPTHWGRRLSLTATLIIGALGLNACGPNVPDPTEAAQQFADQLATEDLIGLTDLALTADSMDPAALADAVEELERFSLTVHLDSAEVDDSDGDEVTATANYTVTWDLTPGNDETEEQQGDDEKTSETWSYPTQAHLVWDDETQAWQPHLTASTLVPGLADGGRVDVVVDQAQRGTIRDGEDNALAMERPVQRIGIDKSHVVQALSQGGAEPTAADIEETLTESATDLAEALDLDPEAFVDRTLAAGERAWVEFIVLRDDEDTDIPMDDIAQIQGAMTMEDTVVLGPSRTFARSLLGTYGEPNAEQIEASDGEFTAGVPTGLTGLQRMYNEQLGGTDGLNISVDNAEATHEPASGEEVSFQRDVVDGQSITTTLHSDVQQLAEEMIDDAEVPAGLVVVRPSDGHILAAADGPAETSWPLAITGTYPPGSTFKIVTALAMLRNGMTPETTVSCPQTMTIDGTEISNFEGYPFEYLGEITLADAIAQSCNTSFVSQWEELAPEDIHDAAVALGLVEDPVTGYTGAFLGSVPTDVEGTQHAAGLFGQGLVQASPLGMATVAASVAAGQTVPPVLVTDPQVDPAQNENLPGTAPLTEDEAATLQELMAGPVEHGTVPILQEVPGAPVYAKTGTAEYIDDGEDLAHTWIMATHGDLAVSLFYTEGFAGAQTNGPVLQEFLTELEAIIPSAG